MKTGTILMVLLIALVALGFLLSDTMHVRQDVARLQQLQAEKLQLQSQLERSSAERVQVEQQLVELQAQQQLQFQIERLQAENEVLKSQVDLARGQLNVQGIAFSDRVKLTGYLEYEDTVLASAVLTYPQEMKLGDSEAVILTLIPNNVLQDILKSMRPNRELVEEYISKEKVFLQI